MIPIFRRVPHFQEVIGKGPRDSLGVWEDLLDSSLVVPKWLNFQIIN